MPLPQRRGRAAILAGWFVVLAAAAFVWIHAIQSLTHPQRVPVKVRPEAFVWGDRVFHDRAHLEQWLHDRGLSYDAWARKHPAAVRIMYPRTRLATKPARATPKPEEALDRPVAARHARARGDNAAGADYALVVMYALVGLSLLAACAITAHAKWHRRGTRLLLSRPYLIAGAAAISLGTFIAQNF